MRRSKIVTYVVPMKMFVGIAECLQEMRMCMCVCVQSDASPHNELLHGNGRIAVSRSVFMAACVHHDSRTIITR